MDETTPQTTTGDPVGNGTGQRRGPSGDNGRRNDFRKKQDHFQGKRDDEEIPTVIFQYHAWKPPAQRVQFSSPLKWRPRMEQHSQT